MSKVQIELEREDAEVALIGLKNARKAWIADVRSVGGKTVPNPFDDAIKAFESALKEHDRTAD